MTTVPVREHHLCLSPTVSLYTQRLQASRSPPVKDWRPCPGRGGNYKVTIADPALLQSSCSRWQPWSLVPGQGPSHQSTNSLLSVFKCPLQSLASKLHIGWDSIGCSPCSSEDLLGVPAGGTSKWVQLPPISPPFSNSQYFCLLTIFQLILTQTIEGEPHFEKSYPSSNLLKKPRLLRLNMKYKLTPLNMFYNILSRICGNVIIQC